MRKGRPHPPVKTDTEIRCGADGPQYAARTAPSFGRFSDASEAIRRAITRPAGVQEGASTVLTIVCAISSGVFAGASTATLP